MVTKLAELEELNLSDTDQHRRIDEQLQNFESQ
jgi:hypothetical protein